MGFWSGLKNAARKVGRVARGLLSQGLNGLRDGVWRFLGIFDFAASFVNIMPRKKLRLHVVILRDESGSPVAVPSDVQSSIDIARDIFKRQANTRIVAARYQGNPVLIRTVDYPAPTAALNPRCDGGAWADDLGEAGSFYSLQTATPGHPLAITGYGAPITVIIVRNVRGKDGCSLGPLTDYIVVDLDSVSKSAGGDDVGLVGSRIIAHEIGHACGLLWHSKQKTNLMYADRPHGTRLGRWQRAKFRNSRHVTYL